MIDAILVVCDDPRHPNTSQAIMNYDRPTREGDGWHSRYTRPRASGRPPAGTRHKRDALECKRCGRRVVAKSEKLDAVLDEFAKNGVSVISLAVLARMI